MGTDIHGVFQRKTATGWEDVPTNYTYARHYQLFAWLGNVRNGYGFAGTPTGTEVTPLSSNRGLPEDFPEMDENGWYPPLPPDADNLLELDSIWMGDHSYSWLLDNEILNTTPPKVTRLGIVTRAEFEAWDGVTAPEHWCSGISGPGVVVEDLHSLTDAATHVRIAWREDLADTCGYFIDEVRRLKALHGQVRFVFGFDS